MLESECAEISLLTPVRLGARMTAFKVQVGGDFAALRAPGMALSTLEAEVDDPALPYVLQITVRVVHGKPVCQSLAASRREGGRPVTRRGLNSLPVEHLVREIAVSAALKMETGPGYVAYDPITESNERAAARRQLAPPRGRQPDPAAHDALVRQVVDAYRDLLDEKIWKPKPIIANEFSISQSYVAALLREARQRGWLGPAIPGRAGESSET